MERKPVKLAYGPEQDICFTMKAKALRHKPVDNKDPLYKANIMLLFLITMGVGEL